MNNKIFLWAIFLLVAGVVCFYLENSFYQYIDDNGVLHESYFLPLGMFCLIGAVCLFFVDFAGRLIRLILKR